MIDVAIGMYERILFVEGATRLATAILREGGSEAEERLDRLLGILAHARDSTAMIGQVLSFIDRTPSPAATRFRPRVVAALERQPPSIRRARLLADEPGHDEEAEMDALVAAVVGRPEERGSLPLAGMIGAALPRCPEVAARRLDDLVARIWEASPRAAVRAWLVVAAVRRTLGREGAEEALAEAVRVVQAAEGEKLARDTAGMLAAGMARGAIPIIPEILRIFRPHADIAVFAACESDSPWGQAPIETIVAAMDELSASPGSRSILSGRAALESARRGEVEDCCRWLERSLDLRRLGAEVELQDYAGDLPSSAPIGAVAQALAARGRLDDAALDVGLLARRAPTAEERMGWARRWTVCLGRGGASPEVRRHWHHEARAIIEESDLHDLPHLAIEALAEVAVDAMRMGDFDEGRAGFWRLRHRARPPTDGWLTGRLVLAEVDAGHLETAREILEAGWPLPGLLAEDLVRNGHGEFAAPLLPKVESFLLGRVYFAAAAVLDEMAADLSGLGPDFAAALLAELPRVGDRERHRCEIAARRLQVRYGDGEAAQAWILAAVAEATARDDRMALHGLFLAVLER